MPRAGAIDELDALKTDIARLRADLAGLAEALLSEGRKEARQAKDHVAEKAEQGVAGLRDAVSSAADAGREALESLEERIGERPMTSLLVAFAVGLVFGRLVNRR